MAKFTGKGAKILIDGKQYDLLGAATELSPDNQAADTPMFPKEMSFTITGAKWAEPMTEKEWLESKDPLKMMDYLLRRNPLSGTLAGETMGYRVSHRKLRLICCGCCRITGMLNTLELANKRGIWWCEDHDGAAPAYAENERTMWPGCLARGSFREMIYQHRFPERQSDIVRCVVGNPFRPVARAPYIAHWHAGCAGVLLESQISPTAIRLAQQAYDTRDWSILLPLSDALEEAGADNADILNHLRHPGPHARGCHVLDLLLGKS